MSDRNCPPFSIRRVKISWTYRFNSIRLRSHWFVAERDDKNKTTAEILEGGLRTNQKLNFHN